jgi:hypothetical protein
MHIGLEVYAVSFSRRIMKVSKKSKLEAMSDLSRDLPAVIGSLSGAGCDKYALARVLWAVRNNYVNVVSDICLPKVFLC